MVPGLNPRVDSAGPRDITLFVGLKNDVATASEMFQQLRLFAQKDLPENSPWGADC